MRHFYYLGCAAIVASLWTGPIHAQSTVYLPDVVELSGPGAVSGTNWRDGAALASVLRLGIRDQRPVLCRLFGRRTPFHARSCADRRGLALGIVTAGMESGGSWLR